MPTIILTIMFAINFSVAFKIILAIMHDYKFKGNKQMTLNVCAARTKARVGNIICISMLISSCQEMKC